MEGENKPSAKFLQARIDALRKALVTRFETIVSAASDASPEPPSNATTTTAQEVSRPPTYVDTASEQVKLEVESAALVRMVEEIMALTRSLKDLWLFGGLDTLGETEKGEDEKMQENIRVVRGAVNGYYEARREGFETGGGGNGEGGAMELDDA